MIRIREVSVPYLLCFGLLSVASAQAASVTIDFEDITDSFTIGAHYAALGATFTNAVGLTAQVSLNEAEFPPHSGVNVAFDQGGPITIQFSSLIDSFSAFFTYASPLLITGYDRASTPVRTAASLFSSNFVSSGNAPNELIQLSYAPGFDHILIAGDPAGGSFAMDDVTFHVAPVTNGVPEPGSLVLAGLGLLVCAVTLRRLQ